MGTAYQILNQSASHFLTFTVCDWVDIFSRQVYRDIVIESFKYCRKEKGLQIWAYVIMTNHVHCILSARNSNLSDIIRDFKRHTSRQIHLAMMKPYENRSDWMEKRFEFASRKNRRTDDFQFWMHHNHALELYNDARFNNCMAYIHLNPVRAGFVEKAEDWLYSSQRNYLGMTNVMEIDICDM